MARQRWRRQDARAIRNRLEEIVKRHCAGVKQRFYARVRIERDTAAKWFAEPPRVPDTHSLRQIAVEFDVSLDWLILGRKPVDRAASGRAKVELWNAIRAHIAKHRGFDSEEANAWLLMLQNTDPGELWEELVRGVQDIEELDARVEAFVVE